MNIIDIELDGWSTIVFKFNWLAVVFTLVLVLGISFLMKHCFNYVSKKSVKIDEVNLGIGNSSVKFSYSKKDQEIAYKIWVELSTRKIGLRFDKENDVIKEVYDSWYKFFETARELLKDIPGNRIPYSGDLIELTEKVLNIGLRPHLTKWQAKYRRWYEEELKRDSGTPQDIQKKYPEYGALIEDLIETNEKMIEFKDVNFGYLQKDVLHNLSFTINKGETVGIIGGTGAGKSTLVSLIGRNYDVRSGQIKIAGKNIQDYKLETLRQHISYVLQNTSLISGTIKENICMSKPYQEETMNKALEVSQAKEFVSRLPQGIESAVVQGGKNFSGGQRQRLTIARALYKQADILVLDDCSSALDYATDAALQKQLQELKEMTKIVISQRTASLKRCDRIMVLYHGKLVGFDCHEELLKNCTVYKEIYESQNSKDGDLNG